MKPTKLNTNLVSGFDMSIVKYYLTQVDSSLCASHPEISGVPILIEVKFQGALKYMTLTLK